MKIYPNVIVFDNSQETAFYFLIQGKLTVLKYAGQHIDIVDLYFRCI